MVGPVVSVANDDVLAAVGVVVNSQLQGVSASATVGVGVIIDVDTALGVGQSGSIPCVAVATIVDEDIVGLHVDDVGNDSIVAHRVIVHVGVADRISIDCEAELGLERQSLFA